MKKRMLSLLLCLVMCLSLVSTPALAATPISEVSVTVTEPANGATPQYPSGYPAGTKYNYSSAWADLATDKAPTAFEYGHTYRFTVTAHANNASFCFPAGMSVRINGVSATVSSRTDTKIIFYRDFTINVPIDRIELSGYCQPVIGKTAGERLNATVPSGAHYSIERCYWRCEEDGQMNDNDVFVAGKHYSMYCRVVPDSGYEFTEDTDLVLNGGAIAVDLECSVLHTNGYFNCWSKPAEAAQVIDRIDVTGFTEPVYGAYPDLELSVPADAHYSITMTSWYSKSTSDGSSDWESQNIFNNPDKEYYMAVTLTPEEGYYFSGENATLNGSQQDIRRCYCYPNEFVIETIRYTVTPPTPTNYTVTFDMGGHGDSITAQTVNKGEKASKPADPTASGWTFGGWYTDAACSTAFDFNTAINAKTTVYAKWTKNTVMLGDVDGNGKINMVDVTKLRQYLTNKTKYPLAVEAAADVDNSGKINMVDVTKIRQYLTNKDKYPLG